MKQLNQLTTKELKSLKETLQSLGRTEMVKEVEKELKKRK